MYKPILDRFNAWYEGEIADRPPVTVMNVWKEGAELSPARVYATPRERLFDLKYRVDRFEEEMQCREYVGDSFPLFRPTFGSDECACLFGGQFEFTKRSSWAVHNMEDIRDFADQKPNYETDIWSAIRYLTDYSVVKSKGRWITGIGVHDYVADLLVALRGPQELCLDLMDDPVGVRLACDRISSFYPDIYNDLYDRIHKYGQPTGFEGELSYGKTNRIGCDFLCMISPGAAEATIYPALAREIDFLERSYFHLDSEGSLNHLDWLLKQPNLKGIQWVYGVNRGPAVNWIEVYQKIQAAGKSIELLPTSVEDAKATIRELRPQGVWIKMWSLSKMEAEGLVDWVSDLDNWRSSPGQSLR
jgi:hypothetical protein